MEQQNCNNPRQQFSGTRAIPSIVRQNDAVYSTQYAERYWRPRYTLAEKRRFARQKKAQWKRETPPERPALRSRLEALAIKTIDDIIDSFLTLRNAKGGTRDEQQAKESLNYILNTLQARVSHDEKIQRHREGRAAKRYAHRSRRAQEQQGGAAQSQRAPKPQAEQVDLCEYY
ncbi:hypothetical protein BU24DRAFT_481553 [Aaosphaeria arxii CBS 175.79]|uniref:Uncharacterized protein n=1 Tax=Aaosphaeria arxii CBS 175.79 TaxID=1450172 RepID=A0A6A5XMK3_9PLEO|nr:uncharacterized protein BU24DRAFT_481553 [Aaosphaeria arxii CBS 175.79]KAF2014136.1 hypothetical protein BU24DRAFT_481553 [Aaosphaeria arxii CBS 175.79]